MCKKKMNLIVNKLIYTIIMIEIHCCKQNMKVLSLAAL